jgi:hypothetical protein
VKRKRRERKDEKREKMYRESEERMQRAKILIWDRKLKVEKETKEIES